MQKSDAVNYLRERFAAQVDDLEKVSGDFWLFTGEEYGEGESYGFRFLRVSELGFKPTTYALQYLDDKIENNRVELEKEELETLLEGEMIERIMEDKGYVALVYRGQVVGCGFYMDELVSSRIPKGRAKELLELI